MFFSKWKVRLSSKASSVDTTYQLIRVLTVPNGKSLHKLSICYHYVLKNVLPFFEFERNIIYPQNWHLQESLYLNVLQNKEPRETSVGEIVIL